MRLIFPKVEDYRVRALVMNDFGEGCVLIERPWPADQGKTTEWVVWSFDRHGDLFAGDYIQAAFGKTIADAWAKFYGRALRFGLAAHEA